MFLSKTFLSVCLPSWVNLARKPPPPSVTLWFNPAVLTNSFVFFACVDGVHEETDTNSKHSTSEQSARSSFNGGQWRGRDERQTRSQANFMSLNGPVVGTETCHFDRKLKPTTISKQCCLRENFVTIRSIWMGNLDSHHCFRFSNEILLWHGTFLHGLHCDLASPLPCSFLHLLQWALKSVNCNCVATKGKQTSRNCCFLQLCDHKTCHVCLHRGRYGFSPDNLGFLFSHTIPFSTKGLAKFLCAFTGTVWEPYHRHSSDTFVFTHILPSSQLETMKKTTHFFFSIVSFNHREFELLFATQNSSITFCVDNVKPNFTFGTKLQNRNWPQTVLFQAVLRCPARQGRFPTCLKGTRWTVTFWTKPKPFHILSEIDTTTDSPWPKPAVAGWSLFLSLGGSRNRTINPEWKECQQNHSPRMRQRDDFLCVRVNRTGLRLPGYILRIHSFPQKQIRIDISQQEKQNKNNKTKQR